MHKRGSPSQAVGSRPSAPVPPVTFALGTRGSFSILSPVPSLDQAIERLYDLNVGTTPVEEGPPHERPHKPLLLLAVLDLIDEGLATPDRIPWCLDLRERFKERFAVVRKHNDQCNPDLPFRYLAGDGFWQAIEADGSTPIRREIRVSDFGLAQARFTAGFDLLVAIPDNRRKMREALVTRYFPQHAGALLGQINNRQSTLHNPQSASLHEDELEYGRSPAFRRKILEIYDHQCAACGLRIKLPAARDVSFIDAAHLIPFAEARNDHPTNGLALCKNHHWAMDRDIIAPGPDHHWHVSKLVDPRRSNGEKELHELAGKSVLLPKDPAFHPEDRGLQWRLGKLSA